MSLIFLFYPHQLFSTQALPDLSSFDHVYLLEDPLFFGDSQYPLNFHQQKILLHRASMKRYAKEVLKTLKVPLKYLEYDQLKKTQSLFKFLNSQITKFKIKEACLFDPVDYALEKRLKKSAKENKIKLKFLESPNFLNKRKYCQNYFASKKKITFTPFYQSMRRQQDVLMHQDKPVDGQWSFDTENRKALPKEIKIPSLIKFTKNTFIKEAQTYVKKHFANNPGNTQNFIWPTSHEEALSWLKDFLKKRLNNFGPYEDALSTEEDFLFHSVLSASLNIGLLSPDQILKHTLKHADKHAVPLNSLEGFLRQVIGWREYVRGVYQVRGSQQRTQNFFKHQRALGPCWYEGTTGLAPLDAVIDKLKHHAYAHHIERLMVVGNAMLLCEINPDQVYQWFMELHIDAYDWVMVPNVYGMSQFADGGLMMTKPYFSASNYLLKMGHYPKGPWCEIWNALFWRFVGKHQDYLKQNARMGFMVSRWQKMESGKKKKHVQLAEKFIKKATQ